MSAEGQAKVNLILQLKERLKTGFQRARDVINTNVSEMRRRIASLRQSHVEAFQAMRDEIPGFGRAMQMLGNPFVLLTAGLVALGAAGMGLTNFSAGWERDLAKVNVTAQLTPQKLDKLSDKLLEIGSKNVAPLEEIPGAFNRIISSGLDVNQSLAALEPTLRAAKAGFTDIETVAAAGVGVMASSGEDINRVYDILFATLNKGNAEFKDVAQYLPKIVPLAKGAGFALSETAGAWAYLTAQGQTAEQATTGIMNAMKALSNKDIVAGMKSIGVSVFDQNGKMRPLVDTMGQLEGAMAGLTDQQKMMKLDKAGIVDMEAKSAILSMVQNMGKLKEITDFTANSTGQLNAAYENSKTSMDNFKIAINELKAMLKPIGDAFLYMIGSVGTFFANTIGWIKANKTEIIAWATVIGSALAGIGVAWLALNAKMLITNATLLAYSGIMKIVTAAQWLWNVALSANPIGIIIMAIGALVGAIIAAYNKFAWFRGVIWGIWEALKGFAKGVKDGVINVIMGMVNVFKGLGDIIKSVFTLDWDGVKKGWNDTKAGFKQAGSGYLEATIGAGKKAGEGFRKGYQDGVNDFNKKKAAKEGSTEENPFAFNPAGTAPGTGTGTGTALPPALGSASIDSVTGSAKQSHNITVNIDSFVKGLTVQNGNSEKLGESQIEAIIREHLMRVVTNLQVSYQ